MSENKMTEREAFEANAGDDAFWLNELSPDQRKYFEPRIKKLLAFAAQPTVTLQGGEEIRKPSCSDNDWHCTFPECGCNRS